jgi:hypothetical protein
MTDLRCPRAALALALAFFSLGACGARSALFGPVDDQRSDAPARDARADWHQSSGDIVSVKGYGTVATANVDGSGSDWLVKIDPQTGAATAFGSIGVFGVWGLGYWKNKLYGFASSGQVVAIDVASGAATVLHSTAEAWWGAGVTTNAPTS